MTLHLRRRRLLKLIPLSVVSSKAGLAPAIFAQSNKPLRIGYQKSSTLLTIIKANGTLEKLLALTGTKLSWHEFPGGLPLLGNIERRRYRSQR